MSKDSYGGWQETADALLLAHFAINAAIDSNWEEAIKINQKILSINSDNVEALNRLGKAQLYMGRKDKAQNTYKQVLKIDPYNIIARKNFEKISKSGGVLKNGTANGNGKDNHSQVNLSTVFLFEPGKTKIVNLINLAPPAVLASLNCADRTNLAPKKHFIHITSNDGVYLGALPDDLAHKLIALISAGNQYEAYVKCVTTKILTVLIRETYRSEKFANQPSFVDSRNLYIEEPAFA